MSNQELQNYISQSRQAGKTDDIIRQELLSAGWQSDIISRSLNNKTFKKFNIFLKILGIIITLDIVFIIGFFIVVSIPGNCPDAFGCAIFAAWLRGAQIFFLILAGLHAIVSFLKLKSLDKIDKIFFAISTAVFITFLAYFVYFYFGSKLGGKIESDQNHLFNFAVIESIIEDYYYANNQLPQNLSDLDDLASNNYVAGEIFTMKNPDTGQYYEYQIISDVSYKLCADFSTSSEETELEEYQDRTKHQMGHDCITYLINLNSCHNATNPTKCFYEQFAKCQKATIDTTFANGAGYHYEIIGYRVSAQYVLPGENECGVKTKSTANPNANFIGKDMICYYNNALPFNEAKGDMHLCSGPLYDLMKK